MVWAFPEEARTYAETLLDTVDFLNPSRNTEPLLACGFGRAHHLRRRLTMIMLGTTPRHLGWGSALSAFAVSALLLPMTPSWAQKPEEQKEVKAEAFAIEIGDDQNDQQAKEAKSEVHVVVTTDGDEHQVKADSLDKAKNSSSRAHRIHRQGEQRLEKGCRSNQGPEAGPVRDREGQGQDVVLNVNRLKPVDVHAQLGHVARRGRQALGGGQGQARQGEGASSMRT